MPTTTFNFRIDEDVKGQVDEIAAQIGMSTASVFNVFAKRFVQERGFPFEVKAPKYTDFESEEEAADFVYGHAKEMMRDAR